MKKNLKIQKTSDALQILGKRYLKTKAQKRLLTEVTVNSKIARKIYNLRINAGLSQRELAKLVGTTASVICRLEDADYDGHSLKMLHRIAAAMNKQLEVSFISVKVAA